MSNSFIESIKTIINQKIENAGYDKTRNGQIVKVNNDNTYAVQIGGWTYPNVMTVDDIVYNLYDVVKVVMPCNQPSQMFITSSILSDSSMGKKVAYATTMAENADEAVKKVNKTYYQDTQPAGTDHQIGDQWYDTAHNNILYVWDGTTWVTGQDSGEAYDIATNTAKYFWASNSQAVGVGILITQKTQQDFVDDPQNGGMNILVHNNEVVVRDGTTELVVVNDNDSVEILNGINVTGNIQVSGGINDLYKVTDYPISSIAVNANSVTSASGHSVTRQSGYRAIGIVGYNTTNGHIRPTVNYITESSSISSNPTLTAGFANDSASDLSGQTVTFKILWIKATA
jgi:hypothetical protein